MVGGWLCTLFRKSAVIGQLAADGGSRKLVARGQMRALRRVGLVRRDFFFCHSTKNTGGWVGVQLSVCSSRRGWRWVGG